MRNEIELDLYQTPSIVEHLDSELFLKIPLYQTKIPYQPLYINDILFSKFFPMSDSLEDQKKLISQLFSVTLDNATNTQVGWAYVDRQADPMNIALNGNIGSGRAFYTGKYFNIKGEKTPFAVSNNDFFSSGVFDLEKALRETLLANSILDDTNINTYNILAILDMGEMCLLRRSGKDTEVKRVLIIRIVEKCNLERITHIFYLNKPLYKQDLMQIAVRIGKLEANKFIERILHGAWSAGNVSPRGELLDLETVFAVRGRFPQYSITDAYFENFFGLEYKGQLKIIEQLTTNQKINRDNIQYDFLKEKFEHSMKANISRGLVYLMGFEDYAEIYNKFRQEVDILSDRFNELSRFYMPNFKGIFACHPLSLFIQLFNFSDFFRFYPLLRNQKFLNKELAFKLLSNEKTFEMIITHPENSVVGNVPKEVEQYCVKRHEDQTAMHNQALLFIHQYDILFQKIIKSNEAQRASRELKGPQRTEQPKGSIMLKQLLENRAYVINQDRHYLQAFFSLSYRIAKSTEYYLDRHVQQFIETAVKANRRKPVLTSEGQYITDMILYEEGYACIRLNPDGTHHFTVSLYKDYFESFANSDQNDLILKVDGTPYHPTIEISNNNITLLTPKINNIELLNRFLDSEGTDVFLARNFVIEIKKHTLKLKSLHINNLRPLLDL